MASSGVFSLADRVAVVTGGGGWLGVDICARLARAGASVAVVGRTSATIERAAAAVREQEGEAAAFECDVADGAAVANMADAVVDRFGGIDILVNNAAIYPSRPWLEIAEDEWDAVLATNLRGYFLCARAAFPSMRDRGAGRIVNMASTTFFHSFPNMTVLDYVSSKGAIIGFTRQLAREVGASGVTVNAVAPGAFEQGEPRPEYERWVLEHQSIKRRGRGEDVGNAVTFFASDAAAFITGQTLAVDGGMATP
jgi:NAD(P)-dependent dehydrogenase (short-subunit alcohol dehydrogenase family)